jgi:hypothetical protein
LLPVFRLARVVGMTDSPKLPGEVALVTG